MSFPNLKTPGLLKGDHNSIVSSNTRTLMNAGHNQGNAVKLALAKAGKAGAKPLAKKAKPAHTKPPTKKVPTPTPGGPPRGNLGAPDMPDDLTQDMLDPGPTQNG
jgi:hypothetical protein